MKNIFLLFITIIFTSGCAGTIPVVYTPQNYTRYSGSVDIGKFEYTPAKKNIVETNQIQNTALGTVYIGANIADLVQRATAMELEKTGIILGDKSKIILTGDVLEFLASDIGYSVDLTYSVNYKIINKIDSKVLLDKIYKADPKTIGKFGLASDFGPSITEMILGGYDKFIKDDQVRHLLSSGS